VIDVEKPVWLLDVDGVVNTTRPGWGADINEEAVRAHPPRNAHP